MVENFLIYVCLRFGTSKNKCNILPVNKIISQSKKRCCCCSYSEHNKQRCQSVPVVFHISFHLRLIYVKTTDMLICGQRLLLIWTSSYILKSGFSQMFNLTQHDGGPDIMALITDKLLISMSSWCWYIMGSMGNICLMMSKLINLAARQSWHG